MASMPASTAGQSCRASATPYPPFARGVGLRCGGQGDQSGQRVVIEIGGVEQCQRMQDPVALLTALKLKRDCSCCHATSARVDWRRASRVSASVAACRCARGVGPAGGLGQRSSRIAQRQRQVLCACAASAAGSQSARLAMVPAWPASAARSMRVHSRARGQQALVVRGIEHRVAGIGQVGLGPQRGQVLVEIQALATRQLRLQRIAAQRVAQPGLIQRHETAPVLSPCQLQQEGTAQVGCRNPVGVLLRYDSTVARSICWISCSSAASCRYGYSG